MTNKAIITDFQTYAEIIKTRYDSGIKIEKQIKHMKDVIEKLGKESWNLQYARQKFLPNPVDALWMSELGDLMNDFDQAGFKLPDDYFDRWCENNYNGKNFSYELRYDNFFPIEKLKVYPVEKKDGIRELSGRFILDVELKGTLSRSGKPISKIKTEHGLYQKMLGKCAVTGRISGPFGQGAWFKTDDMKKSRVEGEFDFKDYPDYIGTLTTLIEDVQTGRKKLYYSLA